MLNNGYYYQFYYDISKEQVDGKLAKVRFSYSSYKKLKIPT